jgi:hypothetical protein
MSWAKFQRLYALRPMALWAFTNITDDSKVQDSTRLGFMPDPMDSELLTIRDSSSQFRENRQRGRLFPRLSADMKLPEEPECG